MRWLAMFWSILVQSPNWRARYKDGNHTILMSHEEAALYADLFDGEVYFDG